MLSPDNFVVFLLLAIRLLVVYVMEGRRLRDWKLKVHLPIRPSSVWVGFAMLVVPYVTSIAVDSDSLTT